jgi:hypothetical protein
VTSLEAGTGFKRVRPCKYQELANEVRSSDLALQGKTKRGEGGFMDGNHGLDQLRHSLRKSMVQELRIQISRKIQRIEILVRISYGLFRYRVLDVHIRSCPSVRYLPNEAGTMIHICMAILVEDDLATSLS